MYRSKKIGEDFFTLSGDDVRKRRFGRRAGAADLSRDLFGGEGKPRNPRDLPASTKDAPPSPHSPPSPLFFFHSSSFSMNPTPAVYGQKTFALGWGRIGLSRQPFRARCSKRIYCVSRHFYALLGTAAAVLAATVPGGSCGFHETLTEAQHPALTLYIYHSCTNGTSCSHTCTDGISG